MKKLYTLIAVLCVCAANLFAQPAAIINEWTQGTANTNNEWVEILVVQDNLNMTGWKLTDETGTPFITFGAAFSSVPAGTLIVIYSSNCVPFPNDCPKEANLPPDDDVVVADCNYLVVAKSQNADLFIQTQSKWSPTMAFSNTTDSDNPRLFDAGNTLVYDWDNQEAMTNYVSVRPGPGKAVFYTGGDANPVNTFDKNKWTLVTHTDPALTPGAPNGLSGSPNYDWIMGLRTKACIRFIQPEQSVPENIGTTQINLEVINPRPTAQTAQILILAGSTATYTDDYTTVPDGLIGSFTLNVPPNVTQLSFSAPIVWDCLTEDIETVLFKIGNVSNELIAIEYVEHTLEIIDVPKSSATVSIFPPGPIALCPNQDTLLTSSVSATVSAYQWTFNGQNIAGATQADYLAAQPGTYVLTVVTECGDAVSNEIVIEPTPGATVTISPAGPIFLCVNQSITLTSVVSASVSSYQWTFNGQNISGATQENYLAAQPGTYVLTVVTECGNAVSNAVVIEQAPDATVSLSPNDTTVCEGQSVTFTASVTGGNANSFIWYYAFTDSIIPNENGATLTVTATETNLYWVKALTDCGQPLEVAELTVTPAPTVSLSPIDTTVCGDAVVTLISQTSAAVNSYKWFKNGSLVNGAQNPTLNVFSQPGTYTVEITTDCGTALSNEAVIHKVEPALTITPMNATLCPGDSVVFSVELTSGAPYAQVTGYQWNTFVNNMQNPIFGAMADTFKTGTEGQYKVAVFLTGCGTINEIDGGPVTVTITDAPQATITPAGPLSLCADSTVKLTASVDGTALGYKWFKDNIEIAGQTQNQYIASQIGVYKVEIQTSCALATASVTINAAVPPNLSLTSAPNDTVCAGQNIILTAASDQSVLAYRWFKNDVVIPNQTANTYSAADSARYAVEIKSTCGLDTLSQILNVLPTPTVVVLPAVATLCAGQSVTLTAIPSTNPVFSYVWMRNGADISGAPNDSLYTTAQPGTYSVKITTACGLTQSGTVTISVAPTPTLSVAPVNPSICEGDSVKLTLTTNATNVLSYQWQKDSINIPNAIQSTYFAKQIGNYRVKITTECGDYFSPNTLVSLKNKPTVTLTALKDTLCPGQSTVLIATATNATSFVWFEDGQTISGATGATYTANQKGVYVVRATNDCGAASDTVKISVYPTTLTLTTTADGFCPGDSVTIKATADFQPQSPFIWIWTRNGMDIFGPSKKTLVVHEGGQYSVSVISACGTVAAQAPIDVTAYPAPTVDAAAARNNTGGYTLTVTGADSYRWRPLGDLPDTTNAIMDVRPRNTVTYTVVGTDANGCKAQDTLTLTVLPNSLNVPNVFTPNEDGFNDEFHFNTLGTDFTFVELLIYDRWGTLVWKTQNADEGWRGLDSGGNKLAASAYVYALKLIDRRTNKEIFRSGSITLLR